MPNLALRSLVTACLLSSAPAVAQNTWYVDGSGIPPGNGTSTSPYTKIQYAIDQASTLSGDTLLVEPGTYVELVDLQGKDLNLYATGTGTGTATVIDGNVGYSAPNMAVVTIASGEGPGTRLTGFTIENGLGALDATMTYSLGGGVYLEGTSPRFDRCIIQSNLANFGSGVYSVGGTPMFLDCTVAGNGDSSTLLGGGLYLEALATVLTRTDVESNHAGTFGGGLYAKNCTINSFSASFASNICQGDGGGAYFDGGQAQFSNVTVSGNVTTDGNGAGFFVGAGAGVIAYGLKSGNTASNDHAGGGAYVEAGGVFSFTGELSNNTSSRGGGLACFGSAVLFSAVIRDNTAQMFHGGGVYVSPIGGASAHLQGCLLDGNHAIEGPTLQGLGGAVFGPASLEHCTVVNNTASNGGGGVHLATLWNSIHRGNVPADVSSSPSITYSDVEGGAPGVGNIDQDPLFWDPTGDYHLLLGSPCIDAGDPAVPAGTPLPDMGAFEHDGTYGVNYCTAGTSAAGCQAMIGSSGEPSATTGSGFVVFANGGEDRWGLILFGTNGRQANPWGNGTSFQCVAPPASRTPPEKSGFSGGCGGVIQVDLNSLWCAACPKPQANPGAGARVQIQGWYRDPLSTSSQPTSLSDAREIEVQP
jgi:predicted outer membrane repeat protein